jgi:DNA replication protein DnaC
MSREKMAKELVRVQARALKMPGLARTFEEAARQAREESWSYEEYLQEVLQAEQISRSDSAIQRCLREAHFPEVKTLECFDWAALEGSFSAPQLLELSRGEYLKKAENIILAGPIGTGKTHLAIGLGVEAARQRHRVLFRRAAELVNSLLEARDQKELGKLQRRYQAIELLIIDELGFIPFERSGGELLFNLLADRYERKATIITTNLAFAEWVKVFAGDEKLTTALLDRLAHHAIVLTTKGKSYRMRKRARVEGISAESTKVLSNTETSG